MVDYTNNGLTGWGMKRMRRYIRETRRRKKENSKKRQQKQERMKIGVPPEISTNLALLICTFAPPREQRKRGGKFSEGVSGSGKKQISFLFFSSTRRPRMEERWWQLQATGDDVVG